MMNVMIETSLLITFPFIMSFAAASDMVSMTISNRLSIALIVLFLLTATAAGMSLQTISFHLLAGFAVLTVTFTMFAMGWIGGGDAKLTAATAVWFGLSHELMGYILISSVLGGALTLGLLACRRHPLPDFLLRWRWIARLHDAKTGIPYGIALAASALIVYPDSRIWLSVVEG
jgi:prepilin peptidase CpaA